MVNLFQPRGRTRKQWRLRLVSSQMISNPPNYIEMQRSPQLQDHIMPWNKFLNLEDRLIGKPRQVSTLKPPIPTTSFQLHPGGGCGIWGLGASQTSRIEFGWWGIGPKGAWGTWSIFGQGDPFYIFIYEKMVVFLFIFLREGSCWANLARVMI